MRLGLVEVCIVATIVGVVIMLLPTLFRLWMKLRR